MKTSDSEGGVPCLHEGEWNEKTSIQADTINLTIRDDIMYVDSFGETRKQFNGEHAIDMGILDSIRTSSSNSQLC